MMLLSLAQKVDIKSVVNDPKTTELELNIVIMIASSKESITILDAITKVRKTNRAYKFVLDRYYCAAISNLVKRKVLVYR